MAKASKQIVYVEGMACNNCALGITRTLQKIGLENVQTEFSTGEVSFTPSKNLPLSDIKAAITRIGYTVTDKEADEPKGFSTLEKRFWFSTLFTLPLFCTMFLPENWILHHPYVQLSLCLPVFLMGAWHFGKSAVGGLKAGVANMDVLILLGSAAAFGYSLVGMFLYQDPDQIHRHLFFETTATIITLVLLGNVLEHRSVKQTTTAIRSLSRLQKVEAKRIRPDLTEQKTETIPASAIQPGDILWVNQGDQIPCDGQLLSDHALVDESMVTGESQPVARNKAATLMGGTLNLGSAFKMKATATGSQTVLSKIIRLVKEAQADKPPIQQLGDKVSAIFVPVVLGLATTAFFISWLVFHLPVAQALMNSIAMLVISCPCAMGLATPTAVIAGIGRAAKKGILVKGGSTLETFKGLRYMVFDKTGTLTDGKFKVEHLQVIDPAYAHRMGSVIHALEQQSSHPIAQSLVNHFSSHPPALLSSVKETKGIGMTGTDGDGHTWQLGSKRILASHSRTSSDFDLYLTRNHRLVAGLNLQDVLKKDARELICWLKKEGITPVLLSGDRRVKCERTAREAGITEWYAEQLPEQKLERIARMRLKGKTAMVGDGINDAPALAKADIGISLSNATQAAMFSAQVILLDAKQLIHIRTAILLGRHTLLTIRQNLFWAFFYNAAAIPIAALGLLNPMVAALAMAFSDVIVIGNSIRLKFKPLK